MDIERELHRLGEPDVVERVFDRITALRLPNSVGAGLRSVLDDLIAKYDGRGLQFIIDTLNSVESWRFTAPPAFPAFLFRNEDPNPATDDSATSLTDNHLHSGASISLRHLLRLLVRSDRPFELEPGATDTRPSRERLLALWGADAWGRAYSLPLVAGALRCFLARMSAPKDWQVGKNVCADRWAKGTFWFDVGVAAREFHGDEEFLDELFAGFNTISLEEDPYETFRNAIFETLQDPTDQRLQSVYGVLSCITLLHCSLSSRAGEGLGRFVDRFDRMGVLKDLAIGSQKSSLISASCASVFADRRVVGAEFRKTVPSYGKSVEACSRALRDGLESHVAGFADFLPYAGRDVRWSAPVGFLRDRRRPLPDPSSWTARTSLTSVSHLAQALVSVLSDPLARAFVSGVDTAGDEAAMPNWPFLAAYEFVASRTPAPLAFSIHAGESFGHGLEGLRRIAECASSKIVTAVGHALALDEQAAESVAGDVWVNPTFEIALLDLCWCRSVDLESSQAESLLSKLLLLGGFGPFGIDAQSILNAWCGMQSLEGLVELGIAEADPLWIPDYREIAPTGTLDSTRMAARLLAYRAPGKTRDALDVRLEGAVAEQFRDFALSVEPRARDLVREMVRGRDIVIEACPTSNVRLAGMHSFHASHIGRVADSGIRVSLSSDDPVVFGTSVGAEYDLVAQFFGSAAAVESAKVSVDTCSAPSTPWSHDALRAVIAESGLG